MKDQKTKFRNDGYFTRQEQLIIFTNQLHKELFTSFDERNLKAAKNTLAAINQIVNEEIKNK